MGHYDDKRFQLIEEFEEQRRHFQRGIRVGRSDLDEGKAGLDGMLETRLVDVNKRRYVSLAKRKCALFLPHDHPVAIRGTTKSPTHWFGTSALFETSYAVRAREMRLDGGTGRLHPRRAIDALHSKATS